MSDAACDLKEEEMKVDVSVFCDQKELPGYMRPRYEIHSKYSGLRLHRSCEQHAYKSLDRKFYTTSCEQSRRRRDKYSAACSSHSTNIPSLHSAAHASRSRIRSA